MKQHNKTENDIYGNDNNLNIDIGNEIIASRQIDAVNRLQSIAKPNQKTSIPKD